MMSRETISIYISVAQKVQHFGQSMTQSLVLTILSTADTSPMWFIVTQTNTIDAISIQFILRVFYSAFYSAFFKKTRSYAPVVTLRVVVIAIAFVTLQHGCTFIGEATELPMASVGVTFDEQGTQIVQ